MPVFNYTPKFLYPHSRQYIFDEVCEKIVRAMEKRNWEVSGLEVEFSTYGSGESKYRYVSSIRGVDFKLHFCRVQSNLGDRYNDIAAVHEISIPKQQIAVYSDESGPSYYLYVGENWDKEKDEFIDEIKVHSKLDKKPRTYLRYSGSSRGYDNCRSYYLIHNNDLGREYSPKGDEPTKFNLHDKFKEFTEWLEKNVLEYILKTPDVVKSSVVEEEIIPYKGEWPLIFGLSDSELKNRVKIGKKAPKELKPENRHASFSSYTRLIPLDLAQNDNDVPELAYDGFIWCDTNQSINQDSSYKSIRNGTYYGSDDKLIVAIKLLYSNYVYVADNAIYEETREQIFDSIFPRERLTNEELGMAFAERGKTIIPINEYKGDYKEPIVLIKRELDFDEIEWIQNK